MDLEVTFLGTGASVPSARRSTAAVLIVRGGERLLFDCGEGTQRQMQRSLGLVQVDQIYLTHFHADHTLGLPGLLKTYDLTDREAPLLVYGPPGLKELFTVLRPLIGRLRYPLELEELRPGESVGHDDYVVESYEAAHNVRASGYALVEDERPGRFDPEAAKAAGVPEGPAFARLQRGEAVEGSDGMVAPDQVMGESRPGRIVVVTGDTAPSPATVAAAADAELLIHDASFAEEDAQRAAETGHSTLGQAAAVAAEAHVKMLALVHISARYHVGKVLEEAREDFPDCVAPRDFDQIVVPFPERGSPHLVPNGARERSGLDGDGQPASDGARRKGGPGVASPEPPPGTAE
ncbi:MAG TPA: ribonuclease Z [Solirubrobacterales bacterium]|jgi:ribonuclease Z